MYCDVLGTIKSLNLNLNPTDSMDHHVAFSAQFSAAHPATQVSSAFKFDQVTFNDGDAYDPMLGLFTAPFPGVYTFSVQIFTYGAERLVVDIQVNGGLAHRMALDTSLLGGSQHGEDSDSMTLTLRLAQGDRVWVEGFGGQGTATLWGGGHTFFTGALLYAI